MITGLASRRGANEYLQVFSRNVKGSCSVT
jgi:hypothetical protein